MINYNPDVLSCLANLSNDEVFTPPEIANRMLDLCQGKFGAIVKLSFSTLFVRAVCFFVR